MPFVGCPVGVLRSFLGLPTLMGRQSLLKIRYKVEPCNESAIKIRYKVEPYNEGSIRF